MAIDTSYELFSDEPEYIKANRDFVTCLPIEGVNRALDLACGTGLITQFLLDRMPSMAIAGIDLDPHQIEIARRNLKSRGIFSEDLSSWKTASESRPVIFLKIGSALDLLDFDNESIDLVIIANAIHLIEDRDNFLREVSRILKQGGVFAFNSVFFSGTFPKLSEKIYAEWMKEAVINLNRLNEERLKNGYHSLKRIRGRSGIAFDKNWLSPDQWSQTLEMHKIKCRTNQLREVHITQRGLEAVSSYGGLSTVLLSGYPVDVASECLKIAASNIFKKHGISHVPRYWLEYIGTKQA